jgi:hypothetical protein
LPPQTSLDGLDKIRQVVYTFLAEGRQKQLWQTPSCALSKRKQPLQKQGLSFWRYVRLTNHSMMRAHAAGAQFQKHIKQRARVS